MEKRINYGDGVGMLNTLPAEICLHILCMLPVKALLVLRAVCKALLSVIDDSEFASFHLRHFSDNVFETRCFDIQCQHESNGSMYISSCSSSGNGTVYDQIWIQNRFCEVLSSLDGLVLLRTSHGALECQHVLWNPSVKKHRQLSIPLLESEDQYFAMGYHASCNDYKILGFARIWNKAWVYSVKTGSWSDVTGSYRQNRVDDYFINAYDETVSFNDGLVWIDDDFLVWFDFGTQKFRSSNGTFYPADYDQSYRGLMVLDGGSTVGLWGYDVEDQPSIWALQTDTMSWIKRHKVSRELLRFGRCKITLSFVERNGEMVWKYQKNGCLEVILYDTETHSIKCHKKLPAKCRNFYVEKCRHFYVESLLMLN